MRATQLWTATDQATYVFTGTGYNPSSGGVSKADGTPVPRAEFGTTQPLDQQYVLAMLVMSLCNNAAIVEDAAVPDGWRSVGDATEVTSLSKALHCKYWAPGDGGCMHLSHRIADAGSARHGHTHLTSGRISRGVR